MALRQKKIQGFLLTISSMKDGAAASRCDEDMKVRALRLVRDHAWGAV
jgi:hypothetical protein